MLINGLRILIGEGNGLPGEETLVAEICYMLKFWDLINIIIGLLRFN